MQAISGGGKGQTSGGSGLSGFDLAAVQQALGQSISEIEARYKQLGIGIPAGGPDPGGPHGLAANAAASGQSLQWGGPGTAEQTDIGGLQNMAQAALGQLQTNNQSNPAIPGTPANTLNQIAQANQAQSNQAFGSGLNTPVGGGTGGAQTGTGV